MLVVCGRCETEYEFDDTLLSERGTTVKCTNCGYQFRVQPPRGLPAGGERWRVSKANGERVEFPSLRELRRAIEAGSISMDDQLSREGGAPRRVREVPELEALFRRRRGREQHAQTLVGVGVPEQVKNAPLPARAVVGSAASKEARARISSVPPTPRISPPPTSLIDMGPTRRSPPPRRAQQTPPESAVAYESFSSEDRKSASFATVPPRAPSSSPSEPRHPDLEATWNSPRNSEPVQLESDPGVQAPVTTVASEHGPPGEAEPRPAVQHGLGTTMKSYGERSGAAASASAVQFASVPLPAPSKTPPPPSLGIKASVPSPPSVPPPPRNPTSMRWIVGFVLLGGGLLLAGTVGRDYLAQFVRGDESSSDARVQSAVEAAWESFRDGDLSAARQQFEAARSAAPGDPNALLGLIQLDVVQADFEWLRLRLLPETEQEQRRTAQERLARYVGQAQAAFPTIPRLPATAKRTALIETDALRVKGEYTAARALVERSKFDPTDPHAAYVLSMLDLAEGTPAWSTVVERLRNALVSERSLGRARSALIYAHAASGDIERARTELDNLGKHPLSQELRAFVDTLAAAQPEDAMEKEAPAAPEASGEPDIDLDEEPSSSSGGGKPPVWRYLDEAGAARRSGDLAGAQSSYEKALAASPGNANALAGLGGIARLQGRYQDAKNYFDQVLQRSPEHLASLVGGADVRWLMGSREGAVLLYRKIPVGSAFHSHAQRRIAEFEGRSGDGDNLASDGDSADQGGGSKESDEPQAPSPSDGTPGKAPEEPANVSPGKRQPPVESAPSESAPAPEVNEAEPKSMPSQESPIQPGDTVPGESY